MGKGTKPGTLSAMNKFAEMHMLIERHHEAWFVKHMQLNENDFLTHVCIEYECDPADCPTIRDMNALANWMLAAVKKKHSEAIAKWVADSMMQNMARPAANE